jgi:hypothetical protein
LNTRAARAWVPAREDDSHTSLTWNTDVPALAGEPFSIAGRPMQIGVRLKDLTLVLSADGHPNTLPLDGRTFGEAIEWLASFGLDAGLLNRPLHFTIPEPVERFEAVPGCEELAGLYSQAANVLEEIRGKWSGEPVRCWPHHFDIATRIGSTGVGMSPGDGYYADPYYYVTPWPYPPADQLPALDSEGKWHTEGWTGAALTYDRMTSRNISRFLNDSLHALSIQTAVISR